MLKLLLTLISPVFGSMSSHLPGSRMISYLPKIRKNVPVGQIIAARGAETHLSHLHPDLSSESSGSKAMSPLSTVPGSTDSGTTIRMGSSRKCGASFSFTTVTVTVAVLTGRLGALLLRGLTFCTVRCSTCLSCASKSRGCGTERRARNLSVTLRAGGNEARAGKFLE